MSKHKKRTRSILNTRQITNTYTDYKNSVTDDQPMSKRDFKRVEFLVYKVIGLEPDFISSFVHHFTNHPYVALQYTNPDRLTTQTKGQFVYLMLKYFGRIVVSIDKETNNVSRFYKQIRNSINKAHAQNNPKKLAKIVVTVMEIADTSQSERKDNYVTQP